MNGIWDLFRLMISFKKDLNKFFISLTSIAKDEGEGRFACWDSGYTYIDWGGLQWRVQGPNLIAQERLA